VKEEILKYRVLCLDPKDFLQIKKVFRLRFRDRGYLDRVFYKWFKAPLDVARNTKPVNKIFFYSHFNPVWEYISVKKIQKAIEGE